LSRTVSARWPTFFRSLTSSFTRASFCTTGSFRELLRFDDTILHCIRGRNWPVHGPTLNGDLLVAQRDLFFHGPLNDMAVYPHATPVDGSFANLQFLLHDGYCAFLLSGTARSKLLGRYARCSALNVGTTC
jgi:hypothetical protein